MPKTLQRGLGLVVGILNLSLIFMPKLWAFDPSGTPATIEEATKATGTNKRVPAGSTEEFQVQRWGLYCDVLDILQPDNLLWDRPLTFTTVRSKKQAAFEENLDFMAAMEILPGRNQCHGSCLAYAMAAMYDYQAPAGFTRQISAGYIAARELQETFNFGMQMPYLALQGSTLAGISHAIREYGIVTEDIYPSNSRINTPELKKQLKELLHSYSESSFEMRMKYNLALKVKNTAAQLIQEYFGRFPTDLQLQDSGYHSGKYLLQRFNFAAGAGGTQKIVLNDVDAFVALVPFLLRHHVPTLLSYHHDQAQQTDSGVYVLKSSEVSGYKHAAIVLGIARSHIDGEIYLEVQNSHANAEKLFIPMNYLRRAFVSAFYLEPRELIKERLKFEDSLVNGAEKPR